VLERLERPVNVFETLGDVALHVRVGAGHVRIEAGTAQRTEVDLVPLRDDEATREAIANATVEARERAERTEIVVDIDRKGRWLSLGRGPDIGVTIRCPEHTDAEVATASANVTATGALGAVSAKTASGNVGVDTVAALETTTASGDVRASVVTGDASVKSASGGVEIGRALGRLSVNLVSGETRVTETLGPASIKSVSGDQSIESVGSDTDLKSVSGDVNIGVRPGLALWIDASSVSGALTSELPIHVEGGPYKDEAAIELRIRTVSGDARIARAALLPA
jgi:hypothetical protein